MSIIDLAEQAEEYANNVVRNIDNCESWGFLRDQKFAELVAAHEREECAKISDCVDGYNRFVNQLISKRIRARGTT